ncbi:MAG: type I glyceraldehyde-3-phosphate dehydrogenase [Ezakiella sp.]|nr:type I glyceraldehyde-3-phosphate dehydrogenase [Ezakiella sp.]MDD7761792.1 type I glyceraldehyde-3-phosphate dehydrogenase [Bacillota bacterium]MDY3946607.1 type I glyceraldehyde-3-phosphate dehydrogenase [Ezakiella sp.]
MKVGINGFGRIGRDVARILVEYPNENLELVQINASGDLDDLKHLFKYDSLYGMLTKEISVEDGGFTIDGKHIEFTAERDPANIDWSKNGVELVIDSTGAFKDMEGLGKHLRGSVKKVILTAPGKGLDNTIVMGVNDDTYDPNTQNIISNASCTTNCLAPVVKVIEDKIGIEKGMMTTCHAYTGDQMLLDKRHKSDRRRARAAALSMIPTTTGAAKAVAEVIPSLKGKLNGYALRVPTPTVSVVDVVCELKRPSSVEEVNSLLKSASENEMKGILGYTEEELVSIDFQKDNRSSIVDSKLTMMMGDNMVKIVSWYDNEWGYSMRVVDLAEMVATRK